jgi:hypothetical protein
LGRTLGITNVGSNDGPRLREWLRDFRAEVLPISASAPPVVWLAVNEDEFHQIDI